MTDYERSVTEQGWYALDYPDRTAVVIFTTRDEVVRIANSDGRVYGVSVAINGPYPSEVDASEGRDVSEVFREV